MWNRDVKKNRPGDQKKKKKNKEKQKTGLLIGSQYCIMLYNFIRNNTFNPTHFSAQYHLSGRGTRQWSLTIPSCQVFPVKSIFFIILWDVSHNKYEITIFSVDSTGSKLIKYMSPAEGYV